MQYLIKIVAWKGSLNRCKTFTESTGGDWSRDESIRGAANFCHPVAAAVVVVVGVVHDEQVAVERVWTTQDEELSAIGSKQFLQSPSNLVAPRADVSRRDHFRNELKQEFAFIRNLPADVSVVAAAVVRDVIVWNETHLLQGDLQLHGCTYILY